MDKELLKNIINKYVEQIVKDYEGEMERREDYLIDKNYLLHNRANDFIKIFSPLKVTKEGEYLIFVDGYLFVCKFDDKNKYLVIYDDMYCVDEDFNFNNNCKFKEMLSEEDKAQAFSFIAEQAVEFASIQENKQK